MFVVFVVAISITAPCPFQVKPVGPMGRFVGSLTPNLSPLKPITLLPIGSCGFCFFFNLVRKASSEIVLGLSLGGPQLTIKEALSLINSKWSTT
ncbi:hypothetical protein H5410_047632 [Solanum commersonii]|uniref:Uncharacterized protein n=1 Tax=Solanum commersonii TaxID=4109 RepID=A0A9J5XJ83_SOLCO|nr:hypothetical protein H5410_047632 [Solanum commersonii]